MQRQSSKEVIVQDVLDTEGNRFLAMCLFTTCKYGQPMLFVSSGKVGLRAALCLAGRVPLYCPTWIVFHCWKL